VLLSFNNRALSSPAFGAYAEDRNKTLGVRAV
jgi:hypothetical protein